jgi:hypothetical protein
MKSEDELFSTTSRRYLDFEQAAHNFSRSWYKICQHYSILKVAQSYTYMYLNHLLRNWVAQTYYNFFGEKSRKWVIFLSKQSRKRAAPNIIIDYYRYHLLYFKLYFIHFFMNPMCVLKCVYKWLFFLIKYFVLILFNLRKTYYYIYTFKIGLFPFRLSWLFTY